MFSNRGENNLLSTSVSRLLVAMMGCPQKDPIIESLIKSMKDLEEN